MLGLLKSKNPYEQNARDVYAQALAQARLSVFYERYGVPDSFEGRFDMLLLHVFMILDASGDAAFNQAVFDVVFADMDQTLREIGIGDMGVPKRQRKMMKAFNGRMHAYDAALGDGSKAADLEGVLARNVYGTVAAPDKKAVKALAVYVRKNVKVLRKGGFDTVLSGDALFKV